MRPTQENPRAYWEQRLLEHGGLKGVGWLGLGESFNHWMYAVRARAFARAVRRETNGRVSSLDVLDVGSGTGFYIDQWRRLGAASVTGSDLTQVAVERLKDSHAGAEVVLFDLTTRGPLPREGAYDAVSVMDVLFHIVDHDAYRRALANLSSLLAERGLLVLSDNLPSHSAMNGAQQVSRTYGEVICALDEAGLDPVRVRPMFWLMNTPVDSSSRFLRAWWRLLSRAVSVHEGVGFTLGAVLYPIELALVLTLRTGPSTKLMLCRKR